jgi:hypothetical protein
MEAMSFPYKEKLLKGRADLTGPFCVPDSLKFSEKKTFCKPRIFRPISSIHSVTEKYSPFNPIRKPFNQKACH